MVHQTFVWWALYIPYKFVKSNIRHLGLAIGNVRRFSPTLHIPFIPCQSSIPFWEWCFLKIWPWKSKLKVIAQGHRVGQTSYQPAPLLFLVNQPSHSWYIVFQNLTLKIQGKSHKVSQLAVWLNLNCFHGSVTFTKVPKAPTWQPKTNSPCTFV